MGERSAQRQRQIERRITTQKYGGEGKRTRAAAPCRARARECQWQQFAREPQSHSSGYLRRGLDPGVAPEQQWCARRQAGRARRTVQQCRQQKHALQHQSGQGGLRTWQCGSQRDDVGTHKGDERSHPCCSPWPPCARSPPPTPPPPTPHTHTTHTQCPFRRHATCPAMHPVHLAAGRVLPRQGWLLQQLLPHKSRQLGWPRGRIAACVAGNMAATLSCVQALDPPRGPHSATLPPNSSKHGQQRTAKHTQRTRHRAPHHHLGAQAQPQRVVTGQHRPHARPLPHALHGRLLAGGGAVRSGDIGCSTQRATQPREMHARRRSGQRISRAAAAHLVLQPELAGVNALLHLEHSAGGGEHAEKHWAGGNAPRSHGCAAGDGRRRQAGGRRRRPHT